MIVRNESADLEPCLVSAAGLADEVVVIDTGSTDDTCDIAVRHGAHVYSFPWCDDFSAARNESIRRARGDWILWLDADDRITQSSWQRIRRLVTALPEANVAYLMPVISPGPDGRPVFDTLHARLFRKAPGILWEYRVHEQIVPSLRRSAHELLRTDIGIVHVGYLHAANVTRKLVRNLRLLDMDLERFPMDPFLLSCRAATLVDLERGAEALVSLSFCELAHVGHAAPAHVHSLKGRAYAMEGDLSQALDAIRAGLALYPQHAKLLFAEAQLLAALGDTATAEACLRGHLVTGVEHEPFECADRTIAEFRVRHLLAELLLHVGRYEEAEHQAIGVTQDRPAYGAAHLTLAESLLAQGKSVEFDAVFRRFDTTADGEVARNVMHAARCRINGQPDQAVAILDKVLVAHPEHLVAMRARVLALFENGIRSGAIVPAIDSVLRLDAMCMCTWAIKRACAAYHSATVLWSQNLRPTAHAS